MFNDFLIVFVYLYFSLFLCNVVFLTFYIKTWNFKNFFKTKNNNPKNQIPTIPKTKIWPLHWRRVLILDFLLFDLFLFIVLIFRSSFVSSIENTCTLQLFLCSFSWIYCISRTMRELQQIQNHVQICNSRAFVIFARTIYCLNYCLDINVFWIFGYVFVENRTYMHIAIVLVLCLLNILYLFLFLIPFMTYCKMLLFFKERK